MHFTITNVNLKIDSFMILKIILQSVCGILLGVQLILIIDIQVLQRFFEAEFPLSKVSHARLQHLKVTCESLIRLDLSLVSFDDRVVDGRRFGADRRGLWCSLDRRMHLYEDRLFFVNSAARIISCHDRADFSGNGARTPTSWQS